MKKLDKLILQSFLGPFILTFLVSVFILLIQYMLKYFDDFVGKNLGIAIFGELMMYFSVNMMPMALPLAVLISSLMTYGKLGEHFELTAIKSAGISLIRVLVPTFIFVVLLSIGAFFFNDNVVPNANLKAFSLLYDIKQAKPALDLKEGQFYAGLPGYSINVKKKHSDGITMNDVLIYDHSGKTNGNMKVIMADSCRMYTFSNDRYLMMELYKGNRYIEEEPSRAEKRKNRRRKRTILKNTSDKKKPVFEANRFVRTSFDQMDLVFSLASFQLGRSDEDLFAGNRYMKSVEKLTASIDSMSFEKNEAHYKMYRSIAGMYKYHHNGYIAPPQKVVERTLLRDSLRALRKTSSIDTAEAELDSTVFDQKLVAVTQRSEKEVKSNEKNKEVPRKLRDDKIAISKKELKPELEFSKKAILSYTEKRREIKLNKDTLFLDSVGLVEVRKSIDLKFKRTKKTHEAVKKAATNARAIKTSVSSTLSRFKYFDRSIDSHTVEKYKKYALAFSCVVMFLIGAPLGAIIKRGGLGLPVIVGVFFFVIFFVLTSASDKWAKGGMMDGMYAAWVANAVLLPPGLFFLKQARKDAKLFDTDFYEVMFDRLVKWWQMNKKNFRWLPGM